MIMGLVDKICWINNEIIAFTPCYENISNLTSNGTQYNMIILYIRLQKKKENK